MVTLPPNFTATKYPGYFWNVKEQQLYSLKIDGVLKPLKRRFPNHFNKWAQHDIKYAFNVSVKGVKRILSNKYLEKLQLEDSVVPTKDENNG